MFPKLFFPGGYKKIYFPWAFYRYFLCKLFGVHFFMAQFCCWENCDFSATVISDLLVEVSRPFFKARVKRGMAGIWLDLFASSRRLGLLSQVSVLCVDRLEQSRPLK